MDYRSTGNDLAWSTVTVIVVWRNSSLLLTRNSAELGALLERAFLA